MIILSIVFYFHIKKIKNNRYIDDVSISTLPSAAIQSTYPTTIHDSPVLQIKRLPSYLRAITPISESHSDWLAVSLNSIFCTISYVFRVYSHLLVINENNIIVVAVVAVVSLIPVGVAAAV